MSRILVTGCGGAAGIAAIQFFRKDGHYVLGVNCLEFSPGFNLADDWAIVPYACEENYISELLKISRDNNIEYILPTVDEELIICSKNKSLFKQYGINIIISDVKVLENCLDKYKFYKALNEAGVSVARTWYLNEKINFSDFTFPVIAKPVTGRGGRGVTLISSEVDMHRFKKTHDNNTYIIQEYAEGIEYSVDTVSDLEGKAIVAVPRKRLEVKGGVCWRGCTDDTPVIIDESKRAVEVLKIVGPACLQLIYTKNGEIKLFEINPRIGGTVSLSVNSGVDIFDLTLKIWEKKEILPNELKFSKKFISRYFTECFFDMN